jgi:hypothetical protein
VNWVKLPIVEHVFIVEHFPIFFSFINEMEWFLGHWMQKLEDYKFLWVLEIKEQHRKHMKGMSDIFFIFLEKITLHLSSNPISSSFLVCFEGFKTWWVHQLSLYKTSLYVRNKDASIKDFKFKIPIFVLFTHHGILNCFRPNTPYLPQSFIELNNF